MNPVVHFEMPYEDRERMVGFYEKAFGWKAQMLGPEMGSYAVMATTEIDEKTQFPKEPGRINGGFFKKDDSNAHPSVVIAVDDIRAAMKKVEEAGGKLLPNSKGALEPEEIPGIGHYAAFIDTEGNRTSMLQPSQM